MKIRPLVLACIALVGVTGCATVSFKRGAGPGNAKADEDACRATTTSPEAYGDCLRERGWMVSTPGTATEEPAALAPAAPAPPPAALPAPVKSPSSAAKPGASAAPVAPVAPEPSPRATGKSAAAAAAPPAEKPLDPMTKVTVSSWWKMGGTNDDLARAVSECVAELGPAHEPNVGPTQVTIGLRDCLRGKKWFAVGGTGGVGTH